MNYLKLLILLPVLAWAESQYSEPYGELDATALTAVQPFIPEGWQAIALSYGELNADGRDDYALVIEPTAVEDTRNRRLLTILSDEDEFNPGAYTLTNSNQYWHFIPALQADHEPLKHIGIHDGVLDIRLDTQDDAGKRTTLGYTFRRENGLFVLVNWQRYQVKRATGMFVETRIDLAAGLRETTSGSMSSPRHKQEQDEIEAGQVWTPCRIGDALGFEF